MVQSSSFFSCVKSQSTLVDETSREMTCDKNVPFGGSVFRQRREVQRNLLHAFAIFQMPLAQNKQYIKAAYFGVVCGPLYPSAYRVGSQ